MAGLNSDIYELPSESALLLYLKHTVIMFVKCRLQSMQTEMNHKFKGINGLTLVITESSMMPPLSFVKTDRVPDPFSMP